MTTASKEQAMGRKRREMVSGRGRQTEWGNKVVRLKWQQQTTQEHLKSQRLAVLILLLTFNHCTQRGNIFLLNDITSQHHIQCPQCSQYKLWIQCHSETRKYSNDWMNNGSIQTLARMQIWIQRQKLHLISMSHSQLFVFMDERCPSIEAKRINELGSGWT